MKLRNKQTGEILDDGYVRETHDFQFDGQKHVLAVFKGNGHRPPERVSGTYTSLAELNAEWEDAPEEPITYYYISDFGAIREGDVGKFVEDEIARKEIGNYFETKEEAELAVRKLKAWKRLESHDLFISKGNRTFVNTDDVFVVQNVQFRIDMYGDAEEDLDLLFSGGEE